MPQVQLELSKKFDYGLASITILVIAAIAAVILNLTGSLSQHQMLRPVKHFDTPEQLTVDQIPPFDAATWQPVTNPINMGMDSNSHWFVATLPSSIPSNERYLVEVNYALMDTLDVWMLDSKGDVAAAWQSGDSLPFHDRQLMHESFLFPVPDDIAIEKVVFRARTTGSLKLPIRFWQQNRFLEYSAFKNLVNGLFFGFLMAMGISNLFFFATTGSKTFFVYTGYVFSLALTLASLQGLGYAYLWPENTWLQGRAVAIFANATIMFAVIFSNWLLDVKQHSVVLAKVLNIIAAVFFVSILVSLVLPYPFLIKTFLSLLSIVVVATLSIGVWLAIKGVVLARYYSLAWVILLLSGLSVALDNLGFISVPIHSNYLLMLGATIETLLLALVLAISYNQKRQQLNDAQAKALQHEKALLATKDELLVAQQQNQDELEYKVQERTLELEIALRELSEANRELENLNTIDPLTNIRNRRHFDKRLLAESRRSRREQTHLSVAMIDIDKFKSINDEYGHAIGDECIKHVATKLREQLRRSTDDVCRYGGEEFSVILPNTDITGARQVIEAMRKAVESQPVAVDGHIVNLTVSGGLATVIIQREKQELELLKFADEQLYTAKQSGRNQVHAAVFSEPEL